VLEQSMRWSLNLYHFNIIRMKENLAKLTEWLDSEEGQAAMDEFVNKMKGDSERQRHMLERFHYRFGDPVKFVALVEKTIAKYEETEYVRHWYSKGIMPPETMYWTLYEYAQRYGRQCVKEEWIEYGNVFTSELYYINGYYFNRMDGQGSVIKVIKKNKHENKTISLNAIDSIHWLYPKTNRL
jgi:hypothetical protein